MRVKSAKIGIGIARTKAHKLLGTRAVQMVDACGKPNLQILCGIAVYQLLPDLHVHPTNGIHHAAKAIQVKNHKIIQPHAKCFGKRLLDFCLSQRVQCPVELSVILFGIICIGITRELQDACLLGGLVERHHKNAVGKSRRTVASQHQKAYHTRAVVVYLDHRLCFGLVSKRPPLPKQREHDRNGKQQQTTNF